MKNYQSILFPYSYNILGSAEDAKDVIQDVMTKFLVIDKTHIKNELGFLIKSVINRSINLKKRNSKFISAEVWLPEPISTINAHEDYEKKDILNYTLLVLFENLTPQERAVFILKEAFDYKHDEIANILEIKVNNSRKILSRAKLKLLNYSSKHTDVVVNDYGNIPKNYIKIIQNGDVKLLEKMLSNDIKLYADGGKDNKVVRELTIGKNAVLDLLFYVYQTYQKPLKFKISEVNHQPAILYFKNNVLVTCQVFEVHHGLIKSVFSIVDPKKLKSIPIKNP